jgi:hypothetical protein
MGQESWQKVFEVVGRDAPRPLATEGPVAYERRMSTLAQKYIRRADQLARVDFSTLPKDALPQFVELVQQAVVQHANSAEGMRPGELREVFDTDENTGQKIRRWVGPESFVKSMPNYLPPRRVVKIAAPPMVDLWRGANARKEASGLW